MLDGKLRRSAAYFAVAGVCAFFGVIHSPLGSEQIGQPHQILELRRTTDGLDPSVVLHQTPYHWAAAYGLSAALLVALSFVRPKPSDELAA
jgi:membrane protease YdiL (CAAX protease family)